MSKASDYEKFNQTLRLNMRGTFCELDGAGFAVVCSRFGNGRVQLPPDEALELGRWLIDTFGEPESAQ